MSEQDRPNLSLGQPPGKLNNRGRTPGIWMWLLLGLQTAALFCLAALLVRQGPTGLQPAGPQSAADVKQLKAVALELEDKGLDAQAARAWKQYLAAAAETEERAEILYRIGKLHMQADEFGEASAALVEAELAAGDDRQLGAKIATRLVDCLRRLGMYGEVGRELSRRVETGGDKPGQARVLATLAGEELTEADLDRMIERRVDVMLSQQGAAADGASRQALLRHLSAPAMRRRLLEELLQVELFCRRARELKLDREDEFIKVRHSLEESLLAGRFLARQLEKIRPTDVDLESYYQANRSRYRQPEAIEVMTIALDAEKDAAKVLEGISSAEEFRAQAGQTPSRRLLRGRDDTVLGQTDALFELSEGEWTKTAHVAGDKSYLVLVEKKTAARTPPLEEVKAQVESDYAARKQQELSAKLFADLMTRYEVKIMAPEAEEKKSDGENE